MVDSHLDFLFKVIESIFHHQKIQLGCLETWFETGFQKRIVSAREILSKETFALSIPHHIICDAIHHWAVSIIVKDSKGKITIILFDSLGLHFGDTRKRKLDLCLELLNSGCGKKDRSEEFEIRDFAQSEWIQRTSHDCGIFVVMFVISVFDCLYEHGGSLDTLENVRVDEETLDKLKENFVDGLQRFCLDAQGNSSQAKTKTPQTTPKINQKQCHHHHQKKK